MPQAKHREKDRRADKELSLTQEFRLRQQPISPEGQAFVEEINLLADEVLSDAPAPAQALFSAPPSPQNAKKLKRASGALFGVAVGFCLLLSCMLLLNLFASNGVGGLHFYVEFTDAMRPGIPRGSLLVTNYRAPAKIKPGDVITYNAVPNEPDTRLTREVTASNKKNGKYVYTTKRAGAELPDSMEVNNTYILGVKLIALPYAGYVVSFVRMYAWGLAIVAAAMGVAAVLLRRWLKDKANYVFVDKRPLTGRKQRLRHGA